MILKEANSSVAAAAIEELAVAGAWNELNDRFFKTLAFGTGGLRGRTIGRVVTQAELGEGGPKRETRVALCGRCHRKLFQFRPGPSAG